MELALADIHVSFVIIDAINFIYLILALIVVIVIPIIILAFAAGVVLGVVMAAKCLKKLVAALLDRKYLYCYSVSSVIYLFFPREVLGDHCGSVLGYLGSWNWNAYVRMLL